MGKLVERIEESKVGFEEREYRERGVYSTKLEVVPNPIRI